MPKLLRLMLLSLLLPTLAAVAQEGSQSRVGDLGLDAVIDHNEFVYSGVTKVLRRAAEVMPKEGYGFKPTEAVRTFGQIVGHVADSQYAFCSIVLGDDEPAPAVESDSKAELIQALEDAFVYCRRAYEGLTATSASGLVRFQGADTPRLGVLTVNQIHTIEHYGNLVVYLRMNDLVPPTSDPEFMKQLQR